MISALERGVHGNADVVRELPEFYGINQFPMRSRGEGIKKTKNFVDIVSGSPLIGVITECDRETILPQGNMLDDTCKSCQIGPTCPVQERASRLHFPCRRNRRLQNTPSRGLNGVSEGVREGGREGRWP